MEHESTQPSGFLLIDKPPGPTSHDVIDELRRRTGIRKIGHAGTLDPFASGLLLVAVGREATREISRFVGLDKTYKATFILGAHSTTLDPEGEIKAVPLPMDTRSRLENALRTLTGKLQQTPPMYSAVKIGGKKLYELAREGKEVERKPRDVEVYSLALTSPLKSLDHGTPLSFEVCIHCSSGTYIRALARDLGEMLGTAGYVHALQRTQIGPFHVRNAVPLEQISPQILSRFFLHG